MKQLSEYTIQKLVTIFENEGEVTEQVLQKYIDDINEGIKSGRSDASMESKNLESLNHPIALTN